MKRSKFSEEQVTYALRQIEAGAPVEDICRHLGVPEAKSTNGRKSTPNWG